MKTKKFNDNRYYLIARRTVKNAFGITYQPGDPMLIVAANNRRRNFANELRAMKFRDNLGWTPEDFYVWKGSMLNKALALVERESSDKA